MGIFRGALTTLLREALGNSVFFCTYEYVRYYMHLQLKEASAKHGNLVDMGIGIVSGGLGGVAFWSAVLPLDVVKTVIQTAPDKSSTTNPFQILKKVIQVWFPSSFFSFKYNWQNLGRKSMLEICYGGEVKTWSTLSCCLFMFS